MPAFIQITRMPYEEPHYLFLRICASNGRQTAEIEFYEKRDSLDKWADVLEAFPRHRGDVFLWEAGSERPEDRQSYYLRLRAFTTDSAGHCAIQFRFNNNANLPGREVSEFCVECEAAAVNRLGRLIRRFAELHHEVLDWTPKDGQLGTINEKSEPIAGPNNR